MRQTLWLLLGRDIAEENEFLSINSQSLFSHKDVNTRPSVHVTLFWVKLSWQNSSNSYSRLVHVIKTGSGWGAT